MFVQPNGTVVAVISHPCFNQTSMSRMVERSAGLPGGVPQACLRIQKYLNVGTSTCCAVSNQVTLGCLTLLHVLLRTPQLHFCMRM